MLAIFPGGARFLYWKLGTFGQLSLYECQFLARSGLAPTVINLQWDKIENDVSPFYSRATTNVKGGGGGSEAKLEILRFLVILKVGSYSDSETYNRIEKSFLVVELWRLVGYYAKVSAKKLYFCAFFWPVDARLGPNLLFPTIVSIEYR